MHTHEVWMRRLDRRRESSAQWLHMRIKDLAWIRERSAFREQLPRLLEHHEWVFIVGCNNSGTTLIHDVLAATNRFSHMPHEGQRYTDVLHRAHRRGYERVWTEYLEDLRLDATDPVSGVDRLVFDWLREIAPPVREKILEKTTANAVRMTWLQRAFPRSSFIGVIRNGYAVVEGIKRKGKKSVERGARHWARVNEIMLDDAENLERFLLIRYEDFVSSPDKILAELGAFLHVPVADMSAGFSHIDRHPTQSSQTSIKDMNSLSIRLLDQRELHVIKRHAGALLANYGYDADGLL